MPPLGCSIWPLMELASSHARKRKLGATSLGWPGRPIGVLSPKCSTFSGDAPPKGLSGVQMGPGATPFTRMPLSTRFSDRERVKAVMAPLVDERSEEHTSDLQSQMPNSDAVFL